MIPQSSAPLLLVRAEAGPAIGTGHVMRMLALAQAWQERGGRAVFLFAQPNEPMRLRLEQDNCMVVVLGKPPASLEDAKAVASYAQAERPLWLAADGYDFRREYLEVLASANLPVLLASDYASAEHFPVTAILNQNAHARAEDYKVQVSDTQLLLGLRYVLLRQEFQNWKTRRPTRTGKISQVLITLGGADPDNMTERVVRALAGQLPKGIRAKVILGANNPHGATLRAAVAQAGPQFECLVRVGDMPALLAASQLAICAGGSTVWEMAFMGVPTLAIILAENHAPLAAAIGELGCGINLGWHDKLNFSEVARQLNNLAGDAGRVAAMAQRGQALVDGAGAERVVDFLLPDKTRWPANQTRTQVSFSS